MLTTIDISNWTPYKVKEWLSGLCDDSSWLDGDKVIENGIGGKELLMMTSEDIELLGPTRVNLQENILEAIEKLVYCNSTLIRETLQSKILYLSCQSRSLEKQLISERKKASQNINLNNIVLITTETNLDKTIDKKQRVSLNTLASISSIVKTVKQIAVILNLKPYSNYDEFRSMRSLLLVQGVELTSTAQRDQFVERPNDVLEKSCKSLADYCDIIVNGTKNFLLVEPFHVEAVKIKRDENEINLGLKVKSIANENIHIIEEIAPLSPAKKTNKLNEGDEILQFNQCIVGWTAKNVKKLIMSSIDMKDIVLMVKRCPID